MGVSELRRCLFQSHLMVPTQVTLEAPIGDIRSNDAGIRGPSRLDDGRLRGWFGFRRLAIHSRLRARPVWHSFGDARFDNGWGVKFEVIDWIDTLSAEHQEASWLRPLLQRMLATASSTLTARQICDKLAHVSFPHRRSRHKASAMTRTQVLKSQMPFSKALWKDGSRTVRISRLEPASTHPKATWHGPLQGLMVGKSTFKLNCRRTP
jgi:hypothetical protein